MEDPSAELTQLTRRLDDVEAAMERLDQATYGRCDHCGSEIEPDLLEGDPTETRCSSCANSTTAT
jgi:RNA polymerase-binding transcription factor DksA